LLKHVIDYQGRFAQVYSSQKLVTTFME